MGIFNVNSGGFHDTMKTTFGEVKIGQVVPNWSSPDLRGESPVRQIIPTVLDWRKINMKLTGSDSAKVSTFFQHLFDALYSTEAELNGYITLHQEEVLANSIWLTDGDLFNGGMLIAGDGVSTSTLYIIYGKVQHIEYDEFGDISSKYYYYNFSSLSLGVWDYLYFAQRWYRNFSGVGDEVELEAPLAGDFYNRMLLHWGNYYNESEQTGLVCYTGIIEQVYDVPVPVYMATDVGDVHIANKTDFNNNYLSGYTQYTGEADQYDRNSLARVLQHRMRNFSFDAPSFCDRPRLSDAETWVSGDEVWFPSVDGDDEGGGGGSGTSGGGNNGEINFESDDIGVPDLPTLDIARSGLCGLYHLTPEQLQSLNNWLWSSNFFDSIIKNFSSPLENIITLGIVPFIDFDQRIEPIGIGNVTSEVNGYKLNKSFYKLDCGTIKVPEIYATYADYEPYLKYWLYLPYIGIVDLPTDDVARGGSLNVTYHFDVFSGACVAFVVCTTNGHTNVLHTYNGNILTTLPISGANFMQMYQQIAGAVVGIASGVASGGAIGAAAGTVGGVIDLMSAKPSYGRSGSISNVNGLMSEQKPYLIKAIPKIFESSLYKSQHGYISNLTVVIGAQSGFLSAQVSDTQLSSIPATREELNEIKALLAEGIFI